MGLLCGLWGVISFLLQVGKDEFTETGLLREHDKRKRWETLKLMADA